MDSTNVLFRELQKEVDQGNQQLDLIFNSLPQSLALVNPNFEILRVNKHFLSLYGVTNNDVMGKKCYEACFGLNDVCEGCLVKKALASKKPEKKIKAFPNGEVCEMTAQPVLDQHGEVTHVLDMRTNITELVEKERELQRIQFAMNQSDDEFWLFDKNWNVVYVSNSASKNLGFKLHELKGSHINKFNLLHRLENLHILFENLKKKKNLRIESIQYKSDGTTYPCEMNLSYFADQGEFVYAVVRNISKRKKYENELIESRVAAERASKLKSVFLANMSHEIRTPLNAIIGFSNFIIEEELDDATKLEMKQEIKANSDYLLQTLGNIMEIAQIESENRIARKEPLNLKILMETVYAENLKYCPSNIDFILNLNLPVEKQMVESDKNIIKQIITRLIDNAFKFTKAGTIEFGAIYNPNKNNIELYVADSGMGIAFEHHDEIFEPFHQLDPMVKGVGIGLSICKAHADLLKTKIAVVSEKGKGSTFKFKLNC
jgi:PAS domain S-box-containing protein